jgi:hypothetical protein
MKTLWLVQVGARWLNKEGKPTVTLRKNAHGFPNLAANRHANRYNGAIVVPKKLDKYGFHVWPQGGE